MRRQRRERSASGRWTLTGPALLLCLAPTTQAAGEQGAHVHGESTLEMVIDAGVVQAALRGPAANFYGFERAPETREEHAAVAATLAALEAPGDLFAWDAEAACHLETTRVVLPAGADGHGGVAAGQDHDAHDDAHGHEQAGHGHEDHGHEEGGHEDHGGEVHAHAEVSAEWTWACAEHVEPAHVAFHIHAVFPATETVALTLLAADGRVIVEELRASGQRVR